ncbi:DNA-binding protein [Streptococcus hyointestinalis]|uniref:DNA-binding protein n=1 Tax=Streptococcus hyointestinalis TaxID=1337 RepID=UPI0013E01E9B|nr:DNA-binding protein [Streptococcus hyointestinalis]
MAEEFILQLPKRKEKELLARYDNMVQTAIEKALEDKELYKPMVRMSGLCRWLDVSTTTIAKWQKEGMPHMVIDGVTLYDKHKVAQRIYAKASFPKHTFICQ